MTITRKATETDLGARAVAHYASATTTPGFSNVRARGRIVAYSPVPQVCIETDDGQQIWWRADLTEVVAVAWSIGDVVQSIHTDNAYSRRQPGAWDGPESGVRYSDKEIDNLVAKGTFRVLRQQSDEAKS